MTGKAFPYSNPNGWIKSSHSNASGGCVEVKFDGGLMLIRDSKDRRTGQPTLSVGTAEWSSLLAFVTRRESD
ncbi:MAG TPA: DUF397 domain-containing protein [Pseudonocardiaceae bacterium]|nr:DUF397 domain-containing protein [Pseudonocardiaceae bacterium]